MSIGEKRNRLLGMATGDYTAFIDDDDQIGRDYIRLVLEALDKNPDVVGITGEITMNINGRGTVRRKFYHTIENKVYRTSIRGYERPPNHLNPMRRSIALVYQFIDKSHGEDTDWAMRICRGGILKSEIFIDKPIYFYNFNPNKNY
jgi:glycosyltransferase involved in cell wall biosynthesis